MRAGIRHPWITSSTQRSVLSRVTFMWFSFERLSPLAAAIRAEDHRVVPRLRDDAEVPGVAAPSAAVAAHLAAWIHAVAERLARRSGARPQVDRLAPAREGLRGRRPTERH